MKHRFPILAKVILLGGAVTLITTGISLWVSYYHQASRSEETLINNIDNTLENFHYFYEDSEQAEANVSDLLLIKDYVKEKYDEGLYQVEYDPDTMTFQEYEEHFKSACTWIYPGHGLDMSQAKLAFSSLYTELEKMLLEGQLSSGGRALYVGYRDYDRDRFVFIADSRRGRSTGESFYFTPGSHYTIKDTDALIDFKSERYYGYELNGYSTRFYPLLVEQEGKEVEEACFFVEYKTDDVLAKDRQILVTELIVFLLSGIALIILYALLSYYAFVRSINRLNKEAMEVSEKLSSNEVFEPKTIEVHTRDEIGTLATSIGIMEQKLADYIESAKKEAAEKEHELAELEIARTIQLESLPKGAYVDRNLALNAFIKPAKEVGGDFYDYFYVDKKLFVTISDVSGKGVPASLLMMKSRDLLRTKLSSGLALANAIYEANNALAENNHALLFVTSFVGQIDFEKKVIHFVNAGHEKPYILSNGKIERLEGESNLVLGIEKNYRFIEESHAFNEGDILFMFTDGVNESINDKNEEFGYENIAKVLAENKENRLEEIIDKMNQSLESFSIGKEQFDDITMVALKANSNQLELAYDKKDYSIIEDAVNRFNEEFASLPELTRGRVGIIIDELVNNLISYDPTENLKIDVGFSLSQGDLVISIASNGLDYDFLEKHKDKYLSGEEGEDDFGGFGISIVKNISKSVTYQYINKSNVATIILEIE